MKRLLAIAGLLLIATSAQGQLYKWVDESGKVHYSDTPPPAKTKSSKTLSIPNQPAAEAPAGKSIAEQEKDYRKRMSEAADAEAKKKAEDEQAKIRAANCQTARNNLKTLEETGRVYTYDAKGERVYMDDAQRQKAIDDARKAIADWCR